ncbi:MULTISPECIES: DUF2515 domain-containing protein [Geobacillus]|uniref:DUF2515 domain-containing protein n=1 Tax=Geobacillus zalihae TaxID=213419 RepID=A0A7H1RX35_9BACL|nr:MULTISPECIES: DUF2515 domain-containing protein [Geobacillus]MBY6274211.1 DUF2515 domain-containing protein [Bacillaceae bacterium]OQP20728.1 hypothetical protein B1694_13035 [Geobacillus zalihae]QNU18824.1 DUF2515 domain-containing protein [Geobacillus zalihae]RXS91214.1 DUF2515 domain-containing protein [Geobacillus sp. PK12]
MPTRPFAWLRHPLQYAYRSFLYRHPVRLADDGLLRRMAARTTVPTDGPLSAEEKSIVAAIRRKTAEHNRNNVTRTAAYLAFFERHREIHWAFLAHLVSRNGGWNMTDLRGGLLPFLLPEQIIAPLFLFLERANALIFHDAYPQLLLYEESKRRETPLFHLLPALAVSSFMKPMWEHFWETGNAALLTVALIINEQQYIQLRVIEHPFFRTRVLSSWPFIVEQWLGFNDVLIPYAKGRRVALAGTTVRDFADVHHRIHIGKTLYSLLLFDARLFRGACRFARCVPHSGSRADFWPQSFAETPDGRRFYSPRLEEAWPDLAHPFHDHRDWFTDEAIMQTLETLPLPASGDMTSRYERHLAMMKTAAIAAAKSTSS